uniref:Alternative protein NPR1 n=1 Tax=Homo sapiens TaxID=9606 RepID=L8E7A1_HUMAN|nr:alternative protein NPR1 [Homo sapiens]
MGGSQSLQAEPSPRPCTGTLTQAHAPALHLDSGRAGLWIPDPLPSPCSPPSALLPCDLLGGERVT